MHDDIAQLRRRDDHDRHMLDRADRPDVSQADTIVVKTVQQKSYPTKSGVFYACQACSVSAKPEAEGTIPTITKISGVFYVLVLGIGVPPNGTLFKADRIDGFWVAEYYGP